MLLDIASHFLVFLELNVQFEIIASSNLYLFCCAGLPVANEDAWITADYHCCVCCVVWYTWLLELLDVSG